MMVVGLMVLVVSLLLLVAPASDSSFAEERDATIERERDAQAIAPLASVIRSEHGTGPRLLAIAALRALRSPQAVSVLAELFGDRDEAVRGAAVEAWREIRRQTLSNIGFVNLSVSKKLVAAGAPPSSAVRFSDIDAVVKQGLEGQGFRVVPSVEPQKPGLGVDVSLMYSESLTAVMVGRAPVGRGVMHTVGTEVQFAFKMAHPDLGVISEGMVSVRPEVSVLGPFSKDGLEIFRERELHRQLAAMTAPIREARVAGNDSQLRAASLPLPIADLRSVSGSWEGTRNFAGTISPIRMTLSEDGKFQAVLPQGTFTGTLRLVSGRLEYTSDRTGRGGTISLHESEGRRILKGISLENGASFDLSPAQ